MRGCKGTSTKDFSLKSAFAWKFQITWSLILFPQEWSRTKSWRTPQYTVCDIFIPPTKSDDTFFIYRLLHFVFRTKLHPSFSNVKLSLKKQWNNSIRPLLNHQIYEIEGIFFSNLKVRNFQRSSCVLIVCWFLIRRLQSNSPPPNINSGDGSQILLAKLSLQLSFAE